KRGVEAEKLSASPFPRSLSPPPEPQNAPLEFSEVFERFRELCHPSPKRCASCTATFRMVLRRMVADAACLPNNDVFSDAEKTAERERLRAQYPDFPFPDRCICSEEILP